MPFLKLCISFSHENYIKWFLYSGRCVLAATCEYFRTNFRFSQACESSSSIDLNHLGCNDEVVKSVICSFYTNRINLEVSFTDLLKINCTLDFAYKNDFWEYCTFVLFTMNPFTKSTLCTYFWGYHHQIHIGQIWGHPKGRSITL